MKHTLVSAFGWGSSSVSAVFKQPKKGDAETGRLSFKPLEEFLDPADVATVREGGYCKAEVVHIRDHKTPRDPEMQRRHVEKKEERGDRSALGGADVGRGWGPWGPLED